MTTPLAVELSALQLGDAWIRVTERLQAERRGLADQIAAANIEVYISPDGRAEKVAELVTKKRRTDDDLIALGRVYTDALKAIAESETEAQAAQAVIADAQVQAQEDV